MRTYTRLMHMGLVGLLLVLTACQFDTSGVTGQDAAATADGGGDSDGSADIDASAVDGAGGDGQAGLGATVTFRQDVSGYAQGQDTFISLSQSGTDQSASTTIEWAQPEKHGLIQFGGIFAVDGGPVPDGAQIVSAGLEVVVNNDTSVAGTVRQVSVPWSDSVTYSNFGGDTGVGPGEVGITVAAAPTVAGATSIDVTSSVASWSISPTDNHGWIFSPLSTDGADFSSNEAAETVRPLLRVVYMMP